MWKRYLFASKTMAKASIFLLLATIIKPTLVEATWAPTAAKLSSTIRAILSQSIVISSMYVVVDDNSPLQPADKDNQVVQMAFRDFDLKRLDASEKEFSIAVNRWKELHRPRDEVVSLLKARANVRLDSKEFSRAIEDYNECIVLMKVDGETPEGRGRYPEYADTFVGRGLAKEGLADWQGALDDYNKAVHLWNGKMTTERDPQLEYTDANYEGINPYVLTFRGNVLSRVSQYEQALRDYEASSNMFINMRDIARYSDARANYALTLYQLDRQDEAVKTMKDIIRKNPGYADMHVALAADLWSKGDYLEAMKEWRFTCDRIEVGCDAYKDLNWVSSIRRWPNSLSSKLKDFLLREIPSSLQVAQPGQVLAPKSIKLD